DEALDGNNFTDALKFYKEAKDMRPYDPLPASKINNTNKVKERATITADQLYEQYLYKARLAENKREYQSAVGLYNDAIAQRPDKAAQYEAKKRELTDKFRVTSELDEKYKAGLYKEAIKEYDAAIKSNTINSDLYLGRAKCYEKINDFSRALKDYNDSYEADRNNLETIQRRAALYKRNGDYFKALTDYRTYLTINRENIDIYEEMADLSMLINKNTDEAIKDLSDAITVDPKIARLYMKKGLLLFEKKDYHAADNNFSSAIQLDSNNAPAYFNRGKSQLLLKNPVTAGVDFELARRKGLDAADVRNIQAYAGAYFQRSNAKFNEGSKDSAIKLADYAIAINPVNSIYRYNRGEYYFSLYNYKEAINNYDEALALDKNYVDALYKRGLAWYNLGNHKTAIENYTEAIKLNQQYFPAQKGLGDIYLALRDYNSAIVNYEKYLQTIGTVKTAPGQNIIADVYNAEGKSFFAMNHYDKALTAFKTAVKKNPLMTEALYNRGLTFYKTGELKDAIEDMAKAVSLEDNHYLWFYNLGKAYLDKKDFQQAFSSYSSSIKLDTALKIPDAIYYRGYSSYMLQNYSAAVVDYIKAYSFVQNKPEIPINTEMGNIFLNLDKYDDAYDYYNRAYIKDSSNGIALYGIGSALFLKGKTGDALPWFEKSFQTRAVTYDDIKKDKLIVTLRDDKRFKALLKKYY
ncbi:MAG: tetratricopeptide repeat protein, partial [Bacteroidota bacterium]